MLKNKLLIVDDDVTTLKILENIFKNDFQLFLCDNGEDALLLARQERPNLILLDILMPGIDGFKVIEVGPAGAFEQKLTV